MTKTKGSVKGLANIATLIARAPDALAPAPTPKAHGITAESIIAKTVGRLVSLPRDVDNGAVGKYVKAAVTEALNLGHSMAVGQNNMVEDLLKKQYDARTALTMPAVVAAIMEQTGQDTLVLDMDALATVFSRCRIEHDSMDDVGQPNTLEYRLHYLADAGAGDASFALKP